MLYLVMKITVSEAISPSYIMVKLDFPLVAYRYYGGVSLYGIAYNPVFKYGLLRANNNNALYLHRENGTNWQLSAGDYYINQAIKMY